jgi:polyisoprenoid-binding protein YceI
MIRESNMRTATTLVLAGAFIALMATACSDPTANLTAANTGEAKEVTKAEGKEVSFNNENSKIRFHGAKVTGSHKGGFHKFSGKAVLGDDGKSVKQVEVEIDMSSVWTDDPDKPNEKLTGHLKTDDFFDVPNNPTSKFISTEIKAADGANKYNVTGNLTMRGVTKSITFPATITVNDGKVTTKAEFKINRHEWKISYKGMEDDLIKDDVGLTLDINAS